MQTFNLDASADERHRPFFLAGTSHSILLSFAVLCTQLFHCGPSMRTATGLLYITSALCAGQGAGALLLLRLLKEQLDIDTPEVPPSAAASDPLQPPIHCSIRSTAASDPLQPPIHCSLPSTAASHPLQHLLSLSVTSTDCALQAALCRNHLVAVYLLGVAVPAESNAEQQLDRIALRFAW